MVQRQNMQQLAEQIKDWAQSLGFQQAAITSTQLDEAERGLHSWLDKGYHGEMDFMARHGTKRSRPAELVPGTISVISVRMDYLPEATDPWEVLRAEELGYISRYALGRDYHKLMRKRLQQLAKQIAEVTGDFGYRVFVDSAPVLEKPLAANAGLGWAGKHSNIISRDAGSWFFLGEIYTDLPLPTDTAVKNHCGRCSACIDICPTRAIVEPYLVDARRCISYLTIEHPGAIPLELRPQLGNRIYGCDDCQLVCPWNRFASLTKEAAFVPRHQLDAPVLTELFSWSEGEFLKQMEGSPIRRIGHERWLRNIATALGNGPASDTALAALEQRRTHPSPAVREHVLWALDQLDKKRGRP